MKSCTKMTRGIKMKNSLAINFLIAAVILSLLSGCKTTPKQISTSPKNQVKIFPVKIVSEPSGAKIEVNKNYVGETPLTINIEGWETTRTFIRNYSIIAHPVKAGGQMQSKWYRGWNEPSLSRGDKIPNTIYFNMNLIYPTLFPSEIPRAVFP
ncbi:MAG: PEGA domain-containing protein [Desulfobacter sp.]|nr:MAG: PEGA domain-containing protein [Desulfobacter sp.]